LPPARPRPSSVAWSQELGHQYAALRRPRSRMSVLTGLASLANVLTRRGAVAAPRATLFHARPATAAVRAAPDYDPEGYSAEGGGPIPRRGSRARPFVSVDPSSLLVRPGASLYRQDAVFPQGGVTVGSRTLSHARNQVAPTPVPDAMPGIDLNANLYSESFTQGAWIP